MFKKFLKRYFSILLILVMFVSSFSIQALASTVIPSDISHWGYAYKNTTVFNANKTQIGNLYMGEGFTVLDWGDFPDGSDNLYIEYSTSNGPKYGYVLVSDVEMDYKWSTAAIISNSTNIWYSWDTINYITAGSVSAGENVCVLAEENGWSYIEYNTNLGRKCGWCDSSYVTKIGTQYLYINKYPGYKCMTIERDITYTSRTVYAGPGTNYCQVGSISTESVYVFANYTFNSGETWAYIMYHYGTTNKFKTGYIKL